MTAPLLQREDRPNAARSKPAQAGVPDKRQAATPTPRSATRSATWPPARVEQLKSLISAGYSCRQIADEIGVTRNAVIGKVNRLGLSRPKDLLPRGRAESERKRAPWRPKIVSQHPLLLRLSPEPVPLPENISIFNGRGCSLLELTAEKCRWPINEPGAENFCFCGNPPLDGFPYCAGHARIAYKSAARRRCLRASLTSTPTPAPGNQAAGSTETGVDLALRG